ncbi:MAG: hypothetical protein IJU50_05010, partial [Lachnospiraceae bacterium]|nr:hypothetical protein [Lachnospiraceae bacterium]
INDESVEMQNQESWSVSAVRNKLSESRRQEDLAERRDKLWQKQNPGGISPVDKVKELSKMYYKWAKHIGRNITVCSAEEQLQDKLSIFSAYERYITEYRLMMEGLPMEREIARILREYDALLRQAAVMRMVKRDIQGNKNKEETIRDVIRKHVEEEDEREIKNDLSAEEVDQGLTKEQLAGIEAIDQWLVRNFNNGGMLRGITKLRNRHGDFVSAILSKTKRERLHMYYLVQTNARKNQANMRMHVGVSQSLYVPDLNAFKDQMLSTKWNVIGHLTGAYVYMNKLSEAFQLTEEYKEDVKDAGLITMDLKKGQVPDANPEENKDPAMKRMDALRDFYRSLAEYKAALEKVRDADENRKPNLEVQAKILAKMLKGQAKELVRLDRELERAAEREVTTRPFNEMAAASGHVGLTMTVGKTAAGKLSTGMLYSKKFLGWGWGLEQAGWENLEFWGSGISDGFALVGSMMAVTTSIHNIMTSGRSMSKAEFTENLLNMAKAGTDATLSVVTAVNHMTKAADYVNAVIGSSDTVVNAAKDATKATPLMQGLSIASVAISGTISVTKGAQYLNMRSHRKDAQSYFEEKHKRKSAQVPGSEAERKQKRQEKFEKGMLRLAGDLAVKARQTAILHLTSTTISVLSLTLPGVGAPIAAAVGGVFSVVTSILEAWRQGKIADSTFDFYFSIDSILEQVLQIRNKGLAVAFQDTPKGEIRERLRPRVAAAAGFSDRFAAQTHIARKYSDYLYERLFGQDQVQGDERDAYVELVKAMGMSYDEKKRRPEKKIIFKKMLGK